MEGSARRDVSTSNFFSDVMHHASTDALGRSFVAGHIDGCRDWNDSQSVHAFRYYTSYLCDDAANIGHYEELWAAVSGEFITAKAALVGSAFSILEDATRMTRAAKARGDIERYAASLALTRRLWQVGVSQVDVGLIPMLARSGRFEEAVSVARAAREPLDALYLIFKILGYLDPNDTARISEFAHSALECIRSLDNEGERAHHLHRAVFAVRQKSIHVALPLLPECRVIADGISDEFQRVVARLLLVEQVAAIDLDIAEDLACTSWSDQFVPESLSMLMRVAAIGRGREPAARRGPRLERLAAVVLSRAPETAALETCFGLHREMVWEARTAESLRSLVEAIVNSVDLLPEDAFVRDFVKRVFIPEPIATNHATSGYRSDRGAIGVVEQHGLAEIADRVQVNDDDAVSMLTEVIEAIRLRATRCESPDDRYRVANQLTSAVCRMATRLRKSIGRALVSYVAERVPAAFEESRELLLLIEIGVGWYQLGDAARGDAVFSRCAAYVRRCRDGLADAAGQDAEEESILSVASRLLKAHEQLFNAWLGPKTEDTEAERLQKLKAAVRRELAEVLREVPMAHRKSAYEIVAQTLEYGADDAMSYRAESDVACALVEVDLDLAIGTVRMLRDDDARMLAAVDVARVVGESNPMKAAALLDAVRGEADAASLSHIKAIAPYAPEVAAERLAAAPDGQQRDEASRDLLDAISDVKHLCLLGFVLESYRRELRARRAERTDIFPILLNTFLNRLREAVALWSTEMIDCAKPSLVEFLGDFPEGGAYRNAVVCELLAKGSIEDFRQVEALLGMLSSVEAWSQAMGILSERLPVDRLEVITRNALPLRSSMDTPASVAARKLAKALGKVWPGAIDREQDGGRDTPDEQAVEALSLLVVSYAPLRRISDRIGTAIFAEVVDLLQQLVRPRDPKVDYPLLPREMKQRRTGLDAEAAGQIVGDLVVNTTSLPGEMQYSEMARIAGMVGRGGRESVSGLAERFQGADRWRFFEHMFARIRHCPGEFGHLVKPSVEALLSREAEEGEDYFDELLALATSEKIQGAPIGRSLAAEIVGVAKERASATKRDEMRLPAIRARLAATIFLPSDVVGCTKYLRIAVNEALGYMESSTASDEEVTILSRAMSAHLGSCYGRILYLKASDSATLRSIEPYVWHLLLWLAIERNASLDQKNGRKNALKYCREIRNELKTLESVCAELVDHRRDRLYGHAIALWKRLRRKIKYLLVESVRRSEVDVLAKNLQDAVRDIEDPEYESLENLEYLKWFVPVIWRLGVANLGVRSDEIIDSMSKIASISDVVELEADRSVLEPEARLEIEMYVRSLARVDRDKARDFVRNLSGEGYAAGDFGLFDEVLLADPLWVVREMGHVRAGNRRHNQFIEGAQKYARSFRRGEILERLEAQKSLEGVLEAHERMLPERESAVRSHRLMDTWIADDMSAKLAAFIRRVGRDAPESLMPMWSTIRETDRFASDWLHRSVVLEAMTSALYDRGQDQPTADVGDIPEFWTRSEVNAYAVQTKWAADPMTALEVIDVIEVPEVRVRAIADCAKKLQAGNDRGAVLTGLLGRCATLVEVALRFEAARECIYRLYGMPSQIEADERLGLVYSFLEMFAAAPAGWLEVAYLHCIPVLRGHFDEATLARVSGHILSPAAVR